MRKDTKNIYLNGHGLRCPYCGATCQQWTVIDAEYIQSSIITGHDEMAGLERFVRGGRNDEAPVGTSEAAEFQPEDFGLSNNHFVRWQCDKCERRWEEILVANKTGVGMPDTIDVREVPNEPAP